MELMIDSPNPKKPKDESGKISGTLPDPHQHQPIPQQSAETRQALHQILRARTRLVVCLLTLPVYIAAVWFLLQNQRGTDTFMFIYMAMWAAFGFDMARRRCPDCHEQFFVKTIFLNLISKRCVHCGLTPTQRLGGDGGIENRRF